MRIGLSAHGADARASRSPMACVERRHESVHVVIRRRMPKPHDASPIRVVALAVTFALHAVLLLALLRPHPPSPLPPPQRMQVVRIDVADAAPAPPEPVPAAVVVAPPPSSRTLSRAPKAQKPAPVPPPAVAVRDAAPSSPPSAVPEQASPAAEPRASVAETASSHADAAAAVSTGTPAATALASDWQSRVLAHLERYRRYPFAAQRARVQGVAQLRFRVDRRGGVLAARIERSSGSAVLDDEAVAVVARAAPLPPPPAEMPGDAVELVVPVQFRLRR